MFCKAMRTKEQGGPPFLYLSFFFLFLFALSAFVGYRFGISAKENERTYTENIAYQTVQEQLSQKNAACGIVFVGNTEDSSDPSLSASSSNEIISVLEEANVSTVNADGTELFAVIPKKGYKVNVYRTVLNEEGESERVYRIVSSIDTPFFLICNVSDIFSNTEIEVIDEEGNVASAYSPFVSLENGKVQTGEGIVDFTGV